MNPVTTVGEVLDAIQRAKAGASAFCTNFFPAQAKLQGWIDHGELLGELPRRRGVLSPGRIAISGISTSVLPDLATPPTGD